MRVCLLSLIQSTGFADSWTLNEAPTQESLGLAVLLLVLKGCNEEDGAPEKEMREY